MMDRNCAAVNGMLSLSTSQGAILDCHDEFQQLILQAVQREVVSEFKNLQGEKTISTPLYSVLHVVVTTLCKNFSWLKAITPKQQFCWGIVASCCEKIPVLKDRLDWVNLYNYLITHLGYIYKSYCAWKKLSEETHLGYIYKSYCAWKKLPEEKCLRLLEGLPEEIAHSPSEDIRKYECRQINR